CSYRIVAPAKVGFGRSTIGSHAAGLPRGGGQWFQYCFVLIARELGLAGCRANSGRKGYGHNTHCWFRGSRGCIHANVGGGRCLWLFVWPTHALVVARIGGLSLPIYAGRNGGVS